MCVCASSSSAAFVSGWRCDTRQCTLQIGSSIIGRNCRVGVNVEIWGCCIHDNTVIWDGAKLDGALVCDGVVVRPGAVVEQGAVLSYGVEVAAKAVVPAYTRVTLNHNSASANNFDDDADSFPAGLSHLLLASQHGLGATLLFNCCGDAVAMPAAFDVDAACECALACTFTKVWLCPYADDTPTYRRVSLDRASSQADASSTATTPAFGDRNYHPEGRHHHHDNV